ncbi:MAG: ATP-binding protein [Ferruginibacter sp.]
MKKYFHFIFLVFITVNSVGQDPVVDSLSNLLNKSAADTNRVRILLNLSNQFYFKSPVKSLGYSKKALELSRKLKFSNGIGASLNLAGESFRVTGNFPEALRMQLEALDLYREMKNSDGQANSLVFVGVIYMDLSEYRQALLYLVSAAHILQNVPSSPLIAFAMANMGISNNFLNKPDSALYYLRIAKTKNKEFNHPQLTSLILRSIGSVYNNAGKLDSALYYYYAAVKNSTATNESINLGAGYLNLAQLYNKLHQHDSSLFYARKAIVAVQRTTQKSKILEASSLLVGLYRAAKNLDSAFYYQDVVTSLQESLYGKEKFKQLQVLMLEEQQKQQVLQREQERSKNKMKMLALFSIVGIILIIATILYRNIRQKQKINQALEKTLTDLKATQAQLIQSEKMASLGELTAGIAHEIQNPLNFVNNFSEVNKELLQELKEEAGKGNIAEVKTIADDVIINEEKINHHGKRADAIVKGMLQHSRSSSGVKEPTDINALCEEYLKLSYHGLRAKDKSFNATIPIAIGTDFDNLIGNINVVPQDIGRVILNLLTNAFYAVNEKKTLRQAQGDTHYEPTVTISTSRSPLPGLAPSPSGRVGVGSEGRGEVTINVTDNGNGIPQNILDKIFQPFFTTKPTGQGTGLGLSLSYDIIKSHGGEIKVVSKEGEGSKFIIQLPVF